MRKWTAIAVCLAVVLSGAVAYALTRGSDPATAPARGAAKPQLIFPAHIKALAPEIRARLYAQAAEEAKAERTKKAGERGDKERASAPKRTAERSNRDPGIGGPSGGTPAPGGGSSPRPVAVPTPVPTIVPSTAPTPSVSVPAGTTVGTVVDLITAATGAAPKTTLPPSTSLVPDSTVIDCAASIAEKPAEERSGSNKDELVREVVEVLCNSAATPPAGPDDHSGPGNGRPDDDRSGRDGQRTG